MLQRRSCTRTTRRKPCITIRTRTPIPGLLNQTTALWSSTGRYAPRGASSLWLDIILWSFSSPPHIQDANKNTRCAGGVCLCGAGMLALLGMLSYPVWLHSIPILPLPLPPFFFLLFARENWSISLRTWVGREVDTQPDPQEALLGSMPASWTAPQDSSY